MPISCTRRESEVLVPLAQGLSDKAIALSLVLSPHTVRDHLRRVRQRPFSSAVPEGQTIKAGDLLLVLHTERQSLLNSHITSVSTAPFALSELPANPTQQLVAQTDSNEALYRIDVQLDIQSFLADGDSMPLKAGLKLEADVLLERRNISNKPSCSTRRRGYYGGAGTGGNVSRSGTGSCHFGSGAGSNAKYNFTTSGLGGRHVCASRAPKFRCWLIKPSMIS